MNTISLGEANPYSQTTERVLSKEREEKEAVKKARMLNRRRARGFQ